MSNGLNRREFERLSLAAAGGMLTGLLSGCPREAEVAPGSEDATVPDSSLGAPAAAEEVTAVSLLLVEPHVCRGLNSCKGQGASKDNACAGQGTCASVAEHLCHGHNECKGQGGCAGKPGENSCKGQGGCGVPLMEHAWETARKNFEAAMQGAGKSVGEAPPKPSPAD